MIKILYNNSCSKSRGILEYLDENGDWQMIFGLNTLPDYQRKGYAAKIMNAMIHMARQENRKGLVLTCKDRLVPYYSKFGFKNEGVSSSVHGGVV